MTQHFEEARKKFELWFFRDLNDDQRLSLMRIFNLPITEIDKTHGHQRTALRYVIRHFSDAQTALAAAEERGRSEERERCAIEPAGVGVDTPPPETHKRASGDTIMKADVEKMIRDWQAECADHPALHNQGNVLLGRLKALNPSLAMEDFLTGMDCLAEQAQASMTFSSDDDALEFLKLYGHKESQNGVIHGDWRSFDADCRAAVGYLCDEWDFVFEDTGTPSPQPTAAITKEPTP